MTREMGKSGGGTGVGKRRFLGIDAGSVMVSVVIRDSGGILLHEEYRPHLGKPAECLYEMLISLDLDGIDAAARTSTTPDLLEGARVYDSRVAVIAGGKEFFPNLASILHVGGEKFVLIRFDDTGNYLGLRTNTSCAAGTGAFLDQQAKRLFLKDSAELSGCALVNRGDTPKIASRCSVFAKTDIIHRQQEGYSLEEICDGLCRGLANNLADTLELNEPGLSPMIFSGGVSQNTAVLAHLREITNNEILTHPKAHLFAAIGTTLLVARDTKTTQRTFSRKDIRVPAEEKKEYFYPPLELKLSSYPDFEDHQHFEMSVSRISAPVEVDIYRPFPAGAMEVRLGIDIGSTSTKAILLNARNEAVSGFYTRTAGQPLLAVQGIFEVLDKLVQKAGTELHFLSAATTGSGRKFIGKLLAADLIIDEISAHARAAVELDPDIDTIIEIGGQDAKFTTLRNGVVTFSKMNTVCAAGTGSFIEEQAQKLNVPLDEYSRLAQDANAPLASDRCTVFMERDINHYLNKHYSVSEILAAVLFSVRENYLQKVAAEGSIGKRICFQGATAKNKALVAAFEQGLKRPVAVSRYCHLTGALGAALTLADEAVDSSTFRGIDIYRKDIPVRTETCDLCLNHCRIRVAEVNGEEVAYGFLCGRDYGTKKFVRREKIPTLLQKRRKIITSEKSEQQRPSSPCIGIPAGLQLLEELPMWERFFHNLDIQTVSTEQDKTVVASGKKCTGAEFCMPMTAFHGHVRNLAGQCDSIFLPIYIEDKKDRRNPKRMRKYCYYTEYSSVITSLMKHDGNRIQSLRPLINYRQNPLLTKAELARVLQREFPGRYNVLAVNRAYDDAQQYYRGLKQQLKRLYSPPENGEVKVALLGRPYTVLSPQMNKGIPEYFAQLGIETFFTDSLPSAARDNDMENLLDQLPWTYTASIMEAVNFCVKTRGLYPVYVSSFKCSPDSFALEYFKRIMEAYEKPYLILQLDEHDSGVGYETRIEAGVRAFKNHLRNMPYGGITLNKTTVAPEIETDFQGKTLLLPNWDPMSIPLVAANLRAAGVDAYALEETPDLIAESMKMNSGQCIPVNVIAHEYVSYIRKHKLDPATTLLWMVRGGWACNIPMFSPYIKTLINDIPGMEKAGVYNGNLTMVEISPITSVRTYFAYMFGGNLKKIGCMVRPYERNKGETDRVLAVCRDIFESAFLGECSFLNAVEMVIAKIDAIPVDKKTPRPKVAIFGDLYVRDNEVMNQDLIHDIEAAGGEVLITPYNDYAKIIVGAYFKKWVRELHVGEIIMYKSLLAAMQLLENRFQSYFSKYIGKALSSRNPQAEQELAQFNVRLSQDGESMENILKIFRIIHEHPDISLFVQTNPAFCCPSLITEAMAKDIEAITGIPVLTITYDGTRTSKNDIIVPYMKYMNGRSKFVVT